jgi:hypothetical protein
MSKSKRSLGKMPQKALFVLNVLQSELSDVPGTENRGRLDGSEVLRNWISRGDSSR